MKLKNGYEAIGLSSGRLVRRCLVFPNSALETTLSKTTRAGKRKFTNVRIQIDNIAKEICTYCDSSIYDTAS